MSNFKKHSLLILLAMIILIAIPISFAADVDNNATADVIAVDDSSPSVQSVDDSDVLGDNGEGFIEFEKTNIEINEGETATINGVVYYYDEYECYDEVHFSYECTDSSNTVVKSGQVTHMVDYSTEGFSLDLTGLTANGSPYTVAFTPIEDDDYDTFCMYSGGMDPNKPTSVSITVKSLAPSYDYETFVSPASVDYVKGDSSIVSVSAVCGDMGDLEEDVTEWQVYINGASTGVKVGVDAMVKEFNFDLASISDKLNVGVNTLVFHPNQGTLESWCYFDTFNYNPLTVTVSEPVVENGEGFIDFQNLNIEINEGESAEINANVYWYENMQCYDEVSFTYTYVDSEGNTKSGVVKNMEDLHADWGFSLVISGLKANDTPYTVVFTPVEDDDYETFCIYSGGMDPNKPTSVSIAVKLIIPENTGIVYVDSQGSDENNGTENSPVKSIEKAIEIASKDINTEHKIIIREGTYKEHDLNITSALDISGEGDVVIDAEQLGRIFNIETTETVSISGITFKNGKSDNGGAIAIKDAEVTIDNCEFISNEASSYGSAIYWNADDGVLTNSKFSDNTAKNAVVSLGVFSWSTGATGENALVENCSFDNNHNTAYGNCIGLDVTGDGVTVKNTNFTNNKGESYSEHGALYIKGDDAVVENCLFENNTMGMAAAMQLDGEGTLVNNSRFINNKVIDGISTRSGAIEVQNAAEITNCVFIGNGGDYCTEGGAINIVYAEYGGDVLISNNEFIDNSAQKGGAVYVDGGSEDGCEFDSVTIDGNVFDGNIAVNGAGIYTATSDAPVTITNNEFKNMEAESGACIYSDGVDLEVSGNIVENCTSADGNNIQNEYGEIDGNFPGDISIEITANNIFIGETANIVVKVPSNAISNITVTVDGNIVANAKAEKGILNITVSDLIIGEHTVVVSYPADVNYLAGTKDAKFNVTKVEIPVDQALNVTVPENSQSPTFSINLPGATGNFTVNVDGKDIETKELKNGSASITVKDLPAGTHNITVLYSGDDKYAPIVQNTNLTIKKLSTSISASEVSTVYGVSKKLAITLKDANNQVLSGKTVKIVLNGVTYTKTTDAKGQVLLTLPTNLAVKTHNAKITFAEDNNYLGSTKDVKVVVKKSPTKITAKKKTFKVNKAKKYKIVLKTKKGKAIKKVKVTLKIKGKTYKAKTNSKGKATFNLKKLTKKGKYAAVIKFKGNKNFKATNKKVKITVK